MLMIFSIIAASQFFIPLSWRPEFMAEYVLPCDSDTGWCLDADQLRKDSHQSDFRVVVCGEIPWVYTLENLWVLAAIPNTFPQIESFTSTDRQICEAV